MDAKDKWATVSEEYLHELENKARDNEYRRGYIDGMEATLDMVKDIVDVYGGK